VSEVEIAFRRERTAVLATLVRQLGDLQLAEDALQDAFLAAVTTWPRDGVPANAGAWLTTTARRRAIDRLRRGRAQADRADRVADLARLDAQEHDDGDDDAPTSAVDDDRLRLIFTCCHPALALPARTALTLRMLGGLTTGEIAHAFLVAETTMGQRISRAKAKIATAGIPYVVPSEDVLADRVQGVLAVIYLIFNEGYSATAGDRLVRGDLCAEAIRLGRLVVELMPGEAEAWGLLALMALNDARSPARVDADGAYVALGDQDPALWDARRMDEGTAALDRAIALRRPGPYQLQAAISALHLQAPSAEETDWRQIAELYRALAAAAPSPVVTVNHAVAVGFAAGPQAGLALLAGPLADPRLDDYQPLHAAHAELLRRAGDAEGSARAYRRAIALSANDVERLELERRLGALALDRDVEAPARAASTG
jgi:RNA polymerase sigma-70 factor (ECF subfamily)